MIITSVVASYGQTDSTDFFMKEGIALHDKGQFLRAIERYKGVLKRDTNNVSATYKMASCFMSLNFHREAERLCREAIDKFPDSEEMRHVYSTYAYALNQRGKSKEALIIYNQGLEKFPNDYLLHFDRGITTYLLQEFYEARSSFKNAIRINPNHSNSLFYLGIVEDQVGNRISSILALSRFLILDHEGPSSRQILPHLTKQVNKLHAYVKGGGSTSTANTGKVRKDTTAYEFATIEQGLEMLDGLTSTPGKKDKKKTAVKQFEIHMQRIFELLKSEQKMNNTGFYWNFLVPFFIELAEEKHVKAFVYDINSQINKSKEVEKWLKRHKKKRTAYIDWVNSYPFKK